MERCELPRPSAVVRRAVPRILEATVIPLVVFSVAYAVAGRWWAMGATLGWQYLCLARHLVLGHRLPGALVVGALSLSVRTAVAMISGSSFVYFVQPIVGTVATAVAFAVSAVVGRPLVERVVADIVSLPPEVQARPDVRALYRRVTWLWAGESLANAALTLWLLTSQTTGVFVGAKTLANWALAGLTLAVTVVWFRRTLLSPGPEVLGPDTAPGDDGPRVGAGSAPVGVVLVGASLVP